LILDARNSKSDERITKNERSISSIEQEIQQVFEIFDQESCCSSPPIRRKFIDKNQGNLFINFPDTLSKNPCWENSPMSIPSQDNRIENSAVRAFDADDGISPNFEGTDLLSSPSTGMQISPYENFQQYLPGNSPKSRLKVKHKGDTTIITEHRDPYSFYWLLEKDQPPSTSMIVDDQQNLCDQTNENGVEEFIPPKKDIYLTGNPENETIYRRSGRPVKQLARFYERLESENDINVIFKPQSTVPGSISFTHLWQVDSPPVQIPPEEQDSALSGDEENQEPTKFYVARVSSTPGNAAKTPLKKNVLRVSTVF
uniref:Uncharacterized protein n=1 Tax=Romanomermis culicivorax TaxID=13658 RepID=A0A915IBW1_ROMCU